ncbi:hypothetical protein GW17_00024386 [Ensete ventricosum]|nr:hypothetical protein GW17_00024386 [Ensete ventricosum]
MLTRLPTITRNALSGLVLLTAIRRPLFSYHCSMTAKGKQITSVASSCAVLFAGPRWAHKDILAPLDSYQRVIDKAVSRNLMHPRVHHGSRFASSFDEGTPNLFATLLWITVAPRVTATQSSEREIRCQFCPPPTSCITSHCTSRPLVNGSELNDLARLSQIVRWRTDLTPKEIEPTPNPLVLAS